MAHSKNCLFALTERTFSEYCKTLGHPARQRILDLLHDRQTLQFNQICEELPLSRPTVQDHVIRLQRVGLIKIGTGPDGKAGYQIEKVAYGELLGLMRDYLEKKLAA